LEEYVQWYAKFGGAVRFWDVSDAKKTCKVAGVSTRGPLGEKKWRMTVRNGEMVTEADEGGGSWVGGGRRGKCRKVDRVGVAALCKCDTLNSWICTCGQECYCKDCEEESDCGCDECQRRRGEEVENKGEEEEESQEEEQDEREGNMADSDESEGTVGEYSTYDEEVDLYEMSGEE
jgi:hypothetical protein